MPLIHERTFRVRHHECDAYGHVNNANYLRYMQEAAFDASAAAGYPFSRYEEMGSLWLVYETEIEYLNPLRYGDVVTVRTWVENFRRSRSRRRYDLRNADTGEMVARGSTDWVYIDSQSQRPVRIPQEMREAFFPEGAPEDAPRGARFPKPPPPPPGVFTMRRHVEWRDIDTAWHVNNAVYLAYVDECGMQVAAAYGWPAERMTEAGFGIVARRHHIEYRQPALLGDEIEVATYICAVRNATAVRYYSVTRPGDGALLLHAFTRYVWIDVETGRPIRIPERFMAEFAPNMAGGVEWVNPSP
jgi:acyl-CoA thioester hydrolase